MGTRSLTVVIANTFPEDPDYTPQEVCVMYRQFDGYPAEHGRELKEFLGSYKIVNGIPWRMEGPFANGGHCLAAFMVRAFKQEAGGIYLYPAGRRDLGEEYIYFLTATPNKPIHLKLEGLRGEVLYDGTLEDFDPNMKEEE